MCGRKRRDPRIDEEQKKAINAWASNKFTGSIIAGTGFGKSRCGVIAIGKSLDTNNDAKGVVLVPTNQLQEQFKECNVRLYLN